MPSRKPCESITSIIYGKPTFKVMLATYKVLVAILLAGTSLTPDFEYLLYGVGEYALDLAIALLDRFFRLSGDLCIRNMSCEGESL